MNGPSISWFFNLSLDTISELRRAQMRIWPVAFTGPMSCTHIMFITRYILKANRVLVGHHREPQQFTGLNGSSSEAVAMSAMRRLLLRTEQRMPAILDRCGSYHLWSIAWYPMHRISMGSSNHGHQVLAACPLPCRTRGLQLPFPPTGAREISVVIVGVLYIPCASRHRASWRPYSELIGGSNCHLCYCSF